MPTVVDIPTVGLVEFPDSMDEAAITTAAGELYDEANPKPKPGLLQRVKDWAAPGLQAYGEALAADPAANEAAGQAIRDTAGQVVDAFRSGSRLMTQGAQAMGIADMGALTRPFTPPMPLPRIPANPERSTAGQVAAGVANVAIGVAEGLTTPIGIATLGMGALPLTAQRVVGGAFAADMARNLPEMAAQVGEASVNGSVQQQVESVGNMVATAAMTGLAGKHALTPARITAARGVAGRLNESEMTGTTAGSADPVPRVLDLTEIPVPGTKGSMGEPYEYQPLRVAQPDVPPAQRGQSFEPVPETPPAPVDPIVARQALERGDVPAPAVIPDELPQVLRVALRGDMPDDVKSEIQKYLEPTGPLAGMETIDMLELQGLLERKGRISLLSQAYLHNLQTRANILRKVVRSALNSVIFALRLCSTKHCHVAQAWRCGAHVEGSARGLCCGETLKEMEARRAGARRC
jgi:hypothetical protein